LCCRTLSWHGRTSLLCLSQEDRLAARRRGPMNKRLSTAALIAFASGTALAAQPQTLPVEAVSGPPGIDRTTQTEDVKFKSDATQRMTVPVLLSGHGPYRFLVDTGADRTAISREIATRLKFAAGETASLHSVAGVSTVATATVPALQVTSRE